MGECVSFVVMGVPVGWQRGVPLGRGRVITSGRMRAVQTEIGWHARRAMAGRAPMEGAILLSLDAVMAIPPSWSQRKRQAALDGNVPVTARPDLDNIVKCAADAMNGIVWKDDAQVAALHARKLFGASPCWRIAVRPLGEEEMSAGRK